MSHGNYRDYLRRYFDDLAIKTAELPTKARSTQLCVVIAAYKEKENIADVISSTKQALKSLDHTIIVVIDGEDDSTGTIAIQLGALVAYNPFNRGQGAALRVAYKLASQFNPSIIATIDADGQSDPSDILKIIEPIKKNLADVVIGTRRQSHWEKTALSRSLGIYFFAFLISVLIGQKITDPANPLRAFKASAISKVDLRRDQFQAGEVIIKCKLAGFNLKEVPVKNFKRKSGQSKKPKNFFYALQYGWAIIKSYLEAKSSNASFKESVKSKSL
jgi:glycosyltransferase involved in cell wall biosynthesis